MLRIATIGMAAALFVGTLTATPALADGTASIVLAAQAASVDPDHPTTTITGKVVAADGSPAASIPVDLSTNTGWGSVTDATTDADGAFTATLSPNGESDSVTVWADVPSLGIHSEMVAVQVVHGETQTTLLASRTDLDEGQPLTLSGQVTYQGRPLSGRAVFIDPAVDPSRCTSPMYTFRANTDAEGRFSTTIKPSCTATYVARTPAAGFYEGSTTTLPAVSVRPATTTSLSATMDAYGRFQAQGALYAASAGGDVNGKQVLLEYSPDGRTGWQTIRRMKTSQGQFSASFTVNTSGYWRARFAGDTAAAPSVSPVRKTWRWSTSMSKLKASPTRVRKNHYITVSGTLSRYYSSKKRFGAFPGQKVRIIFRFRGKKTWYHVKWVKTDSKGRYKAKVRAYGNGYFAATFAGTSDTWAAGTPNDARVTTYAVPSPGGRSGPPPIMTVLPWRDHQ
ncbi:Nickel uptake substrate-specific transmembrane region [Actinomadura rubteroloni]|uniref:Nickel uptake substrate-specific transmembrane region n=1 Tax=Actinomadura rubteroloni TaxID=1926885 RepID=A0A2P4ULY2_9ACTN|nr:Ig-like domain-containing protein [Actinomadura rubteroloni]POM26064.1 Nickel uptake substrate-specific transmembrane region [Actinomadura rubteroloni]